MGQRHLTCACQAFFPCSSPLFFHAMVVFAGVQLGESADGAREDDGLRCVWQGVRIWGSLAGDGQYWQYRFSMLGRLYLSPGIVNQSSEWKVTGSSGRTKRFPHCELHNLHCLHCQSFPGTVLKYPPYCLVVDHCYVLVLQEFRRVSGYLQSQCL